MQAERIPTRKENIERLFYSFILASFVFALVTVSVRVIFDESYRAATEYRIILFQLSMGCAFLRIPRLLSRLLRIGIPEHLHVLYMLFLWGAIFLGEFALFYYRLPLWDVFLHLYSAVLLTLLGLSLPHLITGKGCGALLTALFAVAFSVLIGVLWEIYEFVFDGILGLNMQKFASPTGGAKLAPLAGRDALVDTMTDLITDLVGALVTASWGFASILHRGRLPRAITLTRVDGK